MSATSVPGSSGDAIVLKRGAAKVYVGAAVLKATVTLLENPDFTFDLEYADCSPAEDRRPPLRLPLSKSTTALLSEDDDSVVVVQTPQKAGWLGATEIRFVTMARVERTTWIEKVEAAVDALLARPRTSLEGRTYFTITKPTADTIVGIELLKAVDPKVEGLVIGALSADGATQCTLARACTAHTPHRYRSRCPARAFPQDCLRRCGHACGRATCCTLWASRARWRRAAARWTRRRRYAAPSATSSSRSRSARARRASTPRAARAARRPACCAARRSRSGAPSRSAGRAPWVGAAVVVVEAGS